MKAFFVITFLLTSLASFGQSFNSSVLEAVQSMPKKGGYVLTNVSPTRMRDAFSWDLDQLLVNDSKATPSYCTTATYVVFFKAMNAWWKVNGFPAKEVQELFKPNLEADGVRVWGRWNSNGPGTAKFFRDTDLGTNFTDISKALPGDFLKIWWNTDIGKKESGHSVVFIRSDEATITFWSSNTSTDGYGERTIPKSMAKRLLFSRLERPENAVKMKDQPEKDLFLESMLSRESSWKEVLDVTGVQ